MCDEDPYDRGAEDDYITEKACEYYVAEERVRITAKLKHLVGEFSARARQYALPAAAQNDPIRGAAALTWAQAARDVDAFIEDIEI